MKMYMNEYLESKDKKDFMDIVTKKYKMKASSAERRWYDCRKDNNKNHYNLNKINQPVEDYNSLFKSLINKVKEDINIEEDINNTILYNKIKDLNNTNTELLNELINANKELNEKIDDLINSKNKEEIIKVEDIPAIKANKYLSEEKIQPNALKITKFEDLKKYLKTQNRNFYVKNGMDIRELNWLEDEGLL